MAIAIALPGFMILDLFLYQFSMFSKKYEENLHVSTKSLIFLHNAPLNSILFSSSISALVSNAS